MITEQVIKDALDGYFYIFECAHQRTRVKRVPKDFVPSHKPNYLYGDEAVTAHGKVWTAEEDAKLTRMFNAGCTYKEMGKELKVSASSANYRWQELCLLHGYSNKRANTQEKFPMEVCTKLANLKLAQNLTLAQAAKKMGLTTNQAANLWKRWRAANGLEAEAA